MAPYFYQIFEQIGIFGLFSSIEKKMQAQNTHIFWQI